MILPLTLFVLLTYGCSLQPGAPETLAPELEVPYKGPGTLATVWVLKGPTSKSTHLVVTKDGASRELPPIENVMGVRWRNEGELIVAASPESGWRTLLVSVDTGTVSTLIDDEGSGDATPSPDGRWIAIIGSDRPTKSPSTKLEIRDLNAAGKLVASHVLPPELPYSRLGPLVWFGAWSPDSEQIALSVDIRSTIQRTFWPTLCVIRRASVGPVECFEEGASEPGGVRPLFWNSRGIYARSARGLLRCTPSASSCTLIYPSEKSRFFVTGTSIGDGALLLAQDS